MVQYIIAIGLFQAILVMFLLWRSHVRSNANSLLVFMVTCIASHLAIKLLIYSFVEDVHVRYQMNTFIGLCYGPLLYLYANKINNDSFRPASRWYVFLPSVIGAIAYFTVAGVLFVSNFSDYRLLEWYNTLSSFLILGSELCFAALSLKIIRKSLKGVRQEEHKLVKRIAYCFLFIVFCSLPLIVIKAIGVSVELIVIRSIVYALLTFICIIIGYYKLIWNPQNQLHPVFAYDVEQAGPRPLVKQTEHLLNTEPAVRKHTLLAHKQEEIWNGIENQIKSHKIFTDSELTLDKLAQLTGFNKYHISETLNSYGQKSFYQYINEYRIQYSMNQMTKLQEQDLPINILLLAYAAGFKSKSSFNRYFKEISGFTPSEYLKSLQRNLIS
jgi:AraC-like DNA-binding protein